MDTADDNFYIELSKHHIRFEPVSQITNIFFDASNRQVFAVRSNGVMGVVVKGPDDKTNINFRLSDRGDVKSVKFSYNLKVLAIQRSWRCVEFMNFSDVLDPNEYTQSCRGKNTQIIGFNWIGGNEIVFIMDHGIEFYQVMSEKKMLKSLKSYSVGVKWYVWLPESSVLLISSGLLGNILHPFLFKNGTMIKLPKFEVDIPVPAKPPKPGLRERDVTMANIYGQLCILVLRNQVSSATLNAAAEIVVYLLQKEGPAKKCHVLRLDLSGRFAINIVDNLVVVHHEASKTSMLFDIQLNGEGDGGITYHYPVLSPLPIKPHVLKSASVPSAADSLQGQPHNCELYSVNWVFFRPNIVIDAKLGSLWYVELKLEPLIGMMTDKTRLVDFLLLRRDSKPTLLRLCRLILSTDCHSDLGTIATIFDKLNEVYNVYYQQNDDRFTQLNEVSPSKVESRAVITQSDMYTHVFSLFTESKDSDCKFVVAVLLEYIRSLCSVHITVQHYLYELVINTLVQSKNFYQLHQFLQYNVLNDSKPLACLLLSLEGIYAPAHQLALDMLKRLHTANEEIIEVLLSKQQLLPVLRFIRSIGAIDTVSPRKFLEAAHATKDRMLFYSVFKFFEQRNLRLRDNPKFAPGEHCDQYVKHFESTFGSESLGQIMPV